MKKSGEYWVVLDMTGPGYFRCQHCGHHVVLNLPMSVKTLSGMGRVYGEEHDRCPAPAPQEGPEVKP